MREIADLVVDLRTASRSHLRVRALILVGAVLYLVGLLAAGGGGWASGILFTTTAVFAVVQPHSIAPSLCLTVAVGIWWASVEQTWHWGLLPAALGLLLTHTAASLCASTPPQAIIPPEVLRTWAARVGVVSAITLGVWGLAGLLLLRTSTALGALPGLVGLFVVVLGLVGYLLWRGRGEQSVR